MNATIDRCREDRPENGSERRQKEENMNKKALTRKRELLVLCETLAGHIIDPTTKIGCLISLAGEYHRLGDKVHCGRLIKNARLFATELGAGSEMKCVIDSAKQFGISGFKRKGKVRRTSKTKNKQSDNTENFSLLPPVIKERGSKKPRNLPIRALLLPRLKHLPDTYNSLLGDLSALHCKRKDWPKAVEYLKQMTTKDQQLWSLMHDLLAMDSEAPGNSFSMMLNYIRVELKIPIPPTARNQIPIFDLWHPVTPLHLASTGALSMQLQKTLIRKKMTANQYWHQIRVSLLRQGHQPNYLDIDGRTPLHFAAEVGNRSAIKTLLAHGADPNIECTCSGTNPLQAALAENSLDSAELLINAKAKLKPKGPSAQAALLTASSHGYHKAVQFLTEHGVNPNCKSNRTGLTPLHLAVLEELPAHIKVIKILLGAGANPNARDAKGRTPFAVLRESINTSMMNPDDLRIRIIKTNRATAGIWPAIQKQEK